MTRLKFHTMTRTSKGVFTSGDVGAVPDEEADRYVSAGLAEEADGDGANTDNLDGLEWGELRSMAADIAEEADDQPADYKTGTLVDYIRKNGG